MEENIKVKIFNNEFVLRSSESGPEETIEVAKYVDKKMKEIAEKTSLVSTSKIAILTALNIADELFRYRKKENKIPKKDLESISKTIKLLDNILEK